MKKKFFAITVSLLTSMLLAPNAVLACSYDSSPYFTYTTHPDVPLQPYAAGKLGILDADYARSYLLTAYRYLENKPLTAEEQSAVVAMWNRRLTVADGCSYGSAAPWLKARLAVGGVTKIDNIDTEKPVDPSEPYENFCNCQPDAFTTAVKTLQTMSTKYGATSQQVKDWVKAQDEVFANCGFDYDASKRKLVLPAALPATADAGLQQQRSYQIAAANFYGQKYEAARQEFLKIAADTGSPWHVVAGYLAVRAMIREADLAKQINVPLLKDAQSQLAKLITEPDYSGLKDSMVALQSFIEARIAPHQYLDDLSHKAFTGNNLAELTKALDIQLAVKGGDGSTELEYTKQPADLRKSDMLDWTLTFKSDDKAAKAHAVEMWKKTHSVPWLVAATAAVDGEDSSAHAIMEAAAKEQSPAAKWTLLYHINRLKLDSNKAAEVRTELDTLLSNPPVDLPKGAVNEFRTQRLPLSRDVAEFVKYGQQKPLAVCSNGGTQEVPDDMEQIATTGKMDPTDLMFTAEAGGALDNKMPLVTLKQVAEQSALVPKLRSNVAWTSFVRAILIGDDGAARALAPLVKAGNKAKAGMIDSYLAATTPEMKKFAATFLMLHFSSAQPNPSWGVLNDDEFGDSSGWWWSAGPIADAGGESTEGAVQFDPEFVTPAQLTQANAQLAKLKKVETAPNYFAHVVLPFAKAHPQDPRVPEALAWFVKATRYGTTDDTTKVYSKQAFNLLHSAYKTNPWTKKTPYYY